MVTFVHTWKTILAKPVVCNFTALYFWLLPYIVQLTRLLFLIYINIYKYKYIYIQNITKIQAKKTTRLTDWKLKTLQPHAFNAELNFLNPKVIWKAYAEGTLERNTTSHCL